MIGAGYSNRMIPTKTIVLPRGSPHVVHESRHDFVVIVAIRAAAALLFRHAIPYRAALALGNNQIGCEQGL